MLVYVKRRWWGHPDLNREGLLSRQILSLLCLPISPCPQRYVKRIVVVHKASWMRQAKIVIAVCFCYRAGPFRPKRTSKRRKKLRVAFSGESGVKSIPFGVPRGFGNNLPASVSEKPASSVASR